MRGTTSCDNFFNKLSTYRVRLVVSLVICNSACTAVTNTTLIKRYASTIMGAPS